MSEDKPITQAMLLIHDVLRQVSKDTGRNGIAIVNLCDALSIVVGQMKESAEKDKATASIDAARTSLSGDDNEQR